MNTRLKRILDQFLNIFIFAYQLGGRSLRQLHYWFKLFCNLVYRYDIKRNIINPYRIGSLMTKSELIEALG